MGILITGSTGFIGRALSVKLTELGNVVYGLDLPETGAGVPVDITTRLPWAGASKLPKGGIDCIVHLAAIASPGICDGDPKLAFDVNVNGTHNVLKFALASGAKRVIFMSSAHVYGISPKYMPTDERHPLWLQDTYTTTKILGEQLCRLFYDNHGLSYTIIRLFNGYGPGQLPGYFIPDMISKALDGHIKGLRGGGTTKDFVYIDDVVRALVSAVFSEYVGVLNIGSGRETKLEAVGSYIADKLNAKLTVASDANAKPTRMCCDNSWAWAVLGWKPEIPLEDGLDRTMAGVLATKASA